MLATKTKQPFAQVQYHSKIFKTRVLYGSDDHPIWNNEIFTIDNHYLGDDVIISVFGKDLTMPIGSTKLTCKDVAIAGGTD